jgi:hypothetical protein
MDQPGSAPGCDRVLRHLVRDEDVSEAVEIWQ